MSSPSNLSNLLSGTDEGQIFFGEQTKVAFELHSKFTFIWISVLSFHHVVSI